MDFQDQDLYGMRFYEDFTGYGTLELIQNFFFTYHKAWVNKNRDVKVMWRHISSFGHLLAVSDTCAFQRIEQGDVFLKTMNVLGLAVLSMLDALEQEEMLKDSEIKDLGIVIGLYVVIWDELSVDQEEYGRIEDWQKDLLGYAVENGIEMEVFKAKESIEDRKDEVSVGGGQSEKDRWKWQAKYNKYRGENEGGPKGLVSHCPGWFYNIISMEPERRKQHSLNGEDPLEGKWSWQYEREAERGRERQNSKH